MNIFTLNFILITICLLCHSIFAIELRVPGAYSTIQSAIDAANFGDTILVAPGIYNENLLLNKSISLISEMGPDLTTIQDPENSSTWGTPETMIILINSVNNGKVIGFSLVGKNDTNGAGIYLSKDGWFIKDCRISNNHTGINSYNASSIIKKNYLTYNWVAIGAGFFTEVSNNIIFENENGIKARNRVKIFNNIIANAFWGIECGGSSDSVRITNNVISTTGFTNFANQQTGIQLNNNENNAIVTNNIVAFCGRDGISVTSGSVVPDECLISYNDVYFNDEDYNILLGNKTGLNGNTSIDPLFCDNKNLFYLSSNSPCIDNGDSLIYDLDGSRSDIGMFGGTNAVDLRYAPSVFNLTSPADSFTINPEGVLFKWNSSFDKDLNDQISYRIILGKNKIQYYPNGTGFPQYMITDIQDTFYTASTEYLVESTLVDSINYYWNVEAIDNTGLFKKSNTIFSFFTSSSTPNDVEKYFEEVLQYSLLQNFPNPFNPTTTIKYSIPTKQYVELIVYDLLGNEVSVLVNQFMDEGSYEVNFSRNNMSSGIYFYKLKTSNFAQTKKLILLK